MITLNRRFKENNKYMAEATCSYCNNIFTLDASNLKRTKSCGCVTNKLIAEANQKHSAYSKYNPDLNLRKAIETITLINYRVKSPHHPHYFQICDFLNTDFNPRLTSAKWLLDTFGAKKENYSIERINNDIGYVCGQHDKCKFCKSNNYNCNIYGFIPLEEQVLNKRNTTAFQLGTKRFCFNNISKHLPVNQRQLDYLWYRKHSHLNKEQRFSVLKEVLFKDCYECQMLELLN